MNESRNALELAITPLLGPYMELALGTTLGDSSLLLRALRASLVGIATAMALSVIIIRFLGATCCVASSKYPLETPGGKDAGGLN